MSLKSFTLKDEAMNEIYIPELERYDKRVNVFYGGAGSGKSVFVVQKMIFKLLKYPNRRCLVVRKVQATIKDSIFEEFKNMLSSWQLLPFCRVNKSTLEIMLPNGSTFIFKGIDDPEKIKSISGIDDIVIEEATELTLDDFSQLNLRLRSKKRYNQIHLMFNPVSKSNWVYHRWFSEDSDNQKNSSNTMVMHTTYKDNKFLQQDYIDELEATKISNPTYYSIYALGRFATLADLVYTNVSIADFDVAELVKDNNNLENLCGLDFGFTADPSAFIAILLDDENKKIYIHDEFTGKGMLTKDIYNKISKKGYSNSPIYADHDNRMITELTSLGLRKLKKANKGAIKPGITYLQQFELIAHHSCIDTIEELENFSWKVDKAGKHTGAPIDEYDHLMDALRYAVSHVSKSNKVTILKRSLFGI